MCWRRTAKIRSEASARKKQAKISAKTDPDDARLPRRSVHPLVFGALRRRMIHVATAEHHVPRQPLVRAQTEQQTAASAGIWRCGGVHSLRIRRLREQSVVGASELHVRFGDQIGERRLSASIGGRTEHVFGDVTSHALRHDLVAVLGQLDQICNDKNSTRDSTSTRTSD